ncbi:hypothetical protein HUW51_14515 [Adhaeribacter swui]|uniref:Uncharacterized protein n=1 Tax=Adhaeribacter swui TaxID=2086471 RepID=A0A7G7G9P1_9BACT|nr:hypothetical protein [Adhaeribacter swui]QNF33875.1 hypothetical protein HUW51_14515 [Adhaeribacter swui]
MEKFTRLVFAAFALAIILYLTACAPTSLAPENNNSPKLGWRNNLPIPLSC